MEKSQAQNKIIQTATVLAVLLLFYAALWVLHREIKVSRFSDVLDYLRGIPARNFFLAFLLSMGSYLALGYHDVLGLVHIRKKLALWKTLLTSFIAYTFSHNIGAAVLTGGGIRYRLYSAWGLSAGETASVLVICGTTFWVGFIAMGAVFFFLEPPELPASVHLPFDSVFFAGVLCLLLLAAYLLSSLFLRKTIKILRWEFPTPSLSLAVGQIFVGGLDWACSGAALYLLLPPSQLDFPTVLAVYLLAQLIGFVSQVPGGLGVLETTVVLLLTPALSAPSVLGALLAFRMVYYLIPFGMGLLAFTAHEIIRNKEGFKRALTILGRWAPDFAPHLFALVGVVGGGLLLFSNADNEIGHRMEWLNNLMPLSLMEGAHLTAGISGAALLVLARGLQQKLESAYFASLSLLGLGSLCCLFKGFDYQEALTLLVFFAALLPCRRFFPRKASLFQQRYPTFWVTVILFVWLGSIWLGVFNHRYDDYSSSLWSTFGLLQDASRFLRSSLAATFTLFLLSLFSLFTSAQPETELPRPADLEKARYILKNFPQAYASLALLGDKALLFNRKSDAFLMYAVEGRSWITLGDPVGPRKEQQELALKFRDLCRKEKAWPFFFQVDQEHFQFYLDMGLTVVKVGEEARVPLKTFKPESLPSGELKSSYQKFKEAEDYSFEVLEPPAWEAHQKELREISEGWLSKNKARAKGFSACFFQENYLKQFPLAIVRKEGKIVAFANLRASGAKEQASVDLLRSGSDAPPHLEDYLWVEALLWAKEKGCKEFVLGLAPLADLEEGPLAPFKNQMGDILSPGSPRDPMDLRKEKERFNPDWAPKYIASPGSLSLAVAFNNLRSLVSKVPRTGLRS